MAFVPILMGSAKDLKHAEAIAAALRELGIEYEIRVASAHKAARFLLELLAEYEADARHKVYITVAGRSNALSGMVNANVTAPVIACPPYSDRFGGADVFSSLRLPSGVAPALVLEPQAAALLAAKMLGLADEELRARVRQAHEESVALIARSDELLRRR